MKLKHLLIISVLMAMAVLEAFGEGPMFRHQDPIINREVQTIYQDIRTKVPMSSTSTFVSTTSAASTYVTLAGTQSLTGILSIKGTTTNDSAATGYVGEIVSTATDGIDSVPGASSAWGDAASFSLTAGDWDLSACMYFGRNGATWQEVNLGISATSGNDATGLTPGLNRTLNSWASTSSAVTEQSLCVARYRVSIAATATYYLKVNSIFSSATPNIQGTMTARRVR